MKTAKILSIICILSFLLGFLYMQNLGRKEDRKANHVYKSQLPTLSKAAEKMSTQILIADWHCDALLWDRSLNDDNEYGHIDFSKMRRGGMALQVFSTVTWVPSKIKSSGMTKKGDSVGLIAIANGWPIQTWKSAYGRARHQSKILDRAIKKDKHAHLVTSQKNMEEFLIKRQGDIKNIAGIKATEGLHAIEGSMDKLDTLIKDGFRVMGLVHMFDNKIGGSSFGENKSGLTDFGKQVIKKLNDKSIIIDLAHASDKLLKDVMKVTTKPVIVSHTGVKGTKKHSRNLSDEQIKLITDKGGLIAIGFWPTAVGANGLKSIVDAIKHVISIAGVDHVSLGSDFDGYVATPISGSSMPLLVQELIDAKFSYAEIEKIMGGNQIEFLLKNLPTN